MLEEFYLAHEIVVEEAQKVQQALFDMIRDRLSRECPKVDVVFPNQPWAYSARMGPKSFGDGKLSLTTSSNHMVLPVCVLEAKR